MSTSYQRVVLVNDDTGSPYVASGGGGGGGGGDASAANQNTQITRATEIRDRIGDTTTPGTGTLLARLAALLSALGSPLQAGGAVSVSNLPATQPVSGPFLTDAQLRASAPKVDDTLSGAPTDRSSTITAGGTAQQLAAANTTRRHVFIQNRSTASLFVSFTTTASTGPTSFELTAGQSYESPSNFCPNGAISVFGATTGQAFNAREA